jgi:endogenous inhibitor of DNA gyrase (YacG/DUF329 family)
MTSPPENITVECPKCGHAFEDWFRPSINADLDPEIAADADYMREATTATCPKCGNVVDLSTLIVEGVWRPDRFIANADDLTDPPKDGDR